MSTTRVVPFEESHLPTVLAWVNDPAVQDAIGTVRQISMAQHREWYAGLQRDRGRLYLIILEGDTAVGMIGLHGIDLQYRNAELWLYLGEEAARRKGTGDRAVRHVAALAFRTLGLHRLYVHVFDYNERALRFFLSCGFVQEGRLRQAAFKRGGFCDKHILGLLATEFQAETE